REGSGGAGKWPTGSQRAVSGDELQLADEVEGPELDLDEFARPAQNPPPRDPSHGRPRPPTGPQHPVDDGAPGPGIGRRLLRAVIGLTVVAGLGVGAYFGGQALGLFDGQSLTRLTDLLHGKPPPEDHGRRARILGDPFAAYSAFRHEDVEALRDQGIEYHYAARHEFPQPLAALGAGEAEFVLTTLDQVLLERPAGKIVAVIDMSMGGDALILDSAEYDGLDSLEELPTYLERHGDRFESGARLALAAGTPSEYLTLELGSLLEVLGPPKEEGSRGLTIDGSFADAGAVWQALEAEQNGVVAAVLWEPWISKARGAGMSVAVSSRDLPRTVVDVLVASTSVIDGDPDLVAAVVTAYYRRVLAQQQDQAALREQVSTGDGVEPGEAEQTLAGLCIFDPFGAKPWFVATQDRPSLLDQAIGDAWFNYERAGKVSGEPPLVSDLVYASAVLTANQQLAASAPAADSDSPGSVAACLARPVEPAPKGDLGPLILPQLDGSWFTTDETGEVVAQGAEVAVDELADILAELGCRDALNLDGGGSDGKGRSGEAQGKARAQALIAGLERRELAMTMEARGEADGKQAPASRLRVLLRRPS
ncbi:MAG: phosphodiester glycosidase family protein, partial [Myxococcales bacterium]|nr:phosphodiester glycosidase family protein [Myxococcales bacterium]